MMKSSKRFLAVFLVVTFIIASMPQLAYANKAINSFENSIGDETEIDCTRLDSGVIEQILSEEKFELINTEDNAYKFSMDILASERIENQIFVKESSYTSVISNNRAVLGTIIDLEYDEGKIEKARLKFKVGHQYIDNTGSKYAVVDKEFEGIKRFQVFKFFEDFNRLFPIESYYDVENNIVYAEVYGPGTYGILDLEKWFYDLGITPEMIKEELTDSVDIVFVVDTTGSMEKTIKNVKENMENVITTLYKEGISPYISVIDYNEYFSNQDNGPTVLRKPNGEVWAYNKEEAIGLVNQLRIKGDSRKISLDALERVEGIDFRDSSVKFIVLITDKGYYTINKDGINPLLEMTDLLIPDHIITSVVTSTSFESAYQPLIEATEGKWFNIHSDFSLQLSDFILSRTQRYNIHSIVAEVVKAELIYLLFFSYIEEESQKEWVNLIEPNNRYSIKIILIGNAFLFGPQKIAVFCTDLNDDKTVQVISTSIANDGKNLYEENYDYEWMDNGVILTFMGEEQVPEKHTIIWDEVFNK
ncbi:MAG: VWA domain-containing protein [Epulopiscium sp.]|nr:VWA domain-containing protein [Candidatus Epulonipiscium sp.]